MVTDNGTFMSCSNTVTCYIVNIILHIPLTYVMGSGLHYRWLFLRARRHRILVGSWKNYKPYDKCHIGV